MLCQDRQTLEARLAAAVITASEAKQKMGSQLGQASCIQPEAPGPKPRSGISSDWMTVVTEVREALGDPTHPRPRVKRC